MTELTVTVKHGKLRGDRVKSVLGPSYLAFKGIPFAAPPIGKLRFKDPEPIEPWSGIRDASKNAGDICPQLSDCPSFDVSGDEDCLYLSVYTTSLTELKPVMLWIHGGGCVKGSGVDLFWRPDYLITKDVVLVSPNYRLGAFGFLHLDNEVAHGNQGLKDLIQALNWVKENISQFGGDPNNVTIFGNSAGAVLVHALTISPSAKGLFHKAVMQSGTMTCPFINEDGILKNGFKLASLLGMDSTDPEEVVTFLQTVPAKKIVEKQVEVGSSAIQELRLVFGPVTDGKAKTPILPLPMDDLLSNVADIPLMIGYTSQEFLKFLKETTDAVIKSFNDSLPINVKKLAALKKLNDADVDSLLSCVIDSYFDGKPISYENLDSLVKFMGDVNFVIPTQMMVNELRKKKSIPIYLYKFSYVGNELTLTDISGKERAVSGAAHCDELSYLYYIPRCKIVNPEPPAVGTNDRKTLERLTQMWTNFAKTGNPTSTLNQFVDIVWKPSTKEELQYLDIGDDLKLLAMRESDVLYAL